MAYDDKNNDKDRLREIDDFLSRFEELNKSSNKAPESKQQTRMERLQSSKPNSQPLKSSSAIQKQSSNVAKDENMTKKKKKKYKLNKKRILTILLTLFITGGLFMGAFATYVVVTAPKFDYNNIYDLLSEGTAIYDDSGKVIETLYDPKDGIRSNISYSDLPENLVDAVVSLEDKTFWDHNGFNFIRLIGAIKDGIFTGKISGTSTITQQLARNLYLPEVKSVRSLSRKIAEAYYTVQLESKLTKEQILEAYLNTIFLGFKSSGVQAASQAYFSKDVQDLTLVECAALAALPQAPDSYSLVKTYAHDQVEPGNPNILSKGSAYTYVFNDVSKKRRDMTLNFMAEQGKISNTELTEALSESDKFIEHMSPSFDAVNDISSYFMDYVVNEVIDDFVYEYGIDRQEASDIVNYGGLQIFTTMSTKMQSAVESEFDNAANFPKVSSFPKDGVGNLVGEKGSVILYKYNNYFDANGTFTFPSGSYRNGSNGDLILLKGGIFNFFDTKSPQGTDCKVEFKKMYVIEEGIFYGIGEGYLPIPSEYKNKDSDGNVVISGDFIKENPEFFTFVNNGMQVSNEHYILGQKTIQPQAAMVITDVKTGHIKAMVGGRNTEGRMLYNRATGRRQPGSSIKPLGVYAPALQKSLDALNKGEKMSYPTANESQKIMYGDYFTAASVIDDSPITVNGKPWPRNWYGYYKGPNGLRYSVEDSINTAAVKVFQDVGAPYSSSFMKKLGITSIVESGAVSDMNAAALALGGMTNGISPLEMSAAYATFGNGGVYTEPVAYTKVTNKKNEIRLEKIPYTERVMDAGVAFIMTDILRTTVTSGLGAPAAFSSQTVAGKTGTTSDSYDIWFSGLTPQYAGAAWIGNDINIELRATSDNVARLWGKVMSKATSGLSRGSFPSAPENVISVNIDSASGALPSNLSSLDPRGTVRSEYFIKGTQPTKTDSSRATVDVCTSTNYRSTPSCPVVETRVGIVSSGASTSNYAIPNYYCNLHNPDPTKYPVNPAGGNANFEGGTVTPPPKKEEDGYIPEGGTPDGDGTGNGGTNDGDEGIPEVPIPDWLNPLN